MKIHAIKIGLHLLEVEGIVCDACKYMYITTMMQKISITTTTKIV